MAPPAERSSEAKTKAGGKKKNVRTALLPLELLFAIFILLDIGDLVNCRLVCKRFNEIICEDTCLQYIVELAKANCVDGPPAHEASLSARLRRLRARQTGWRSLGFHIKKTIEPNDYEPELWRFRGGVFVVGFLRHNDHLRGSYKCFDTLDVYFVRSQDEENSYRTYKLAEVFTDFALDPAQDLIVLWASHAFDDPTRDGLPFHLLSLSEGTLHPLASQPELVIYASHSLKEDTLQICGDVVAITPGDDTEETLFIRWKDGKVQEHELSGSTGCFLSDSCFLVPRQADDEKPSLDIYIIQRRQSAELEFTLAARFELPCPREEYAYVMECESFGTSAYNAQPASLFPALPFLVSPVPSMVFLRISIEENGSTVKTYEVFAYTRPFLSAVRNWKPPRPRAKQQFKTTVWEDWGPDGTFWFADRSFNPHVDEPWEEFSWKQSKYGYRVILPGSIMDFNPACVPADDEDDTDSCSEEYPPEFVYGTRAKDSKTFFETAIETNVPFCWLSFGDFEELTTRYCYYFPDEEVLAVEATDSSIPGSSQTGFTSVDVLEFSR